MISSAAQHRFAATLGVVTHVPHWPDGHGDVAAYEPYVREIRIWANLFERVIISAPRGNGAPLHVAPYGCPNIEWRPYSYATDASTKGQFQRFLQFAPMSVEVARLIAASDLVLLRSPGHPAMIGNLFVKICGKRSVTKFAGAFESWKGERIPSRIERFILRHMGKSHPVLVYGEGMGRHILSFLPALMDESELARARQLSEGKEWQAPWQIVSAGRLIPAKGFDLALQGLAAFHAAHPEVSWNFTLVGDGSQKADLERLAESSGIGDHVDFPGALPFHELQRYYARAHIVIMPGTKEGFGKTIAEAWAHRAIPVAAAAGAIPWIMRDPASGRLFDPSPQSLADALWSLLSEPDRMMCQASEIYHFAQELSLEAFRRRLIDVITTHCGLP